MSHRCHSPVRKSRDLGVLSPAFEDSQTIPIKFTADGADISIPLKVLNIPKNARSLALLMDNSDAPPPFISPFVHWLGWNIHLCSYRKCSSFCIPKDISGDKKFITEGINSFGNIGYNGPSPPPGDPTHHYNITIYALSKSRLKLKKGANKSDLLTAIAGITLGTAIITGIFSRPRLTVDQQGLITNSVSISGLTGFINTVITNIAPNSKVSFQVNDFFAGLNSVILAQIIAYNGQGLPVVNINNIQTGSFDLVIINTSSIVATDQSIKINFMITD